MLPMEAEVMSYLTWGFIIVMVPTLFIVTRRLIIEKNSVFGWFLSHLIILSIGIILWMVVIKGNINVPNEMKSEENSKLIAAAGVTWALSMFFFIKGIQRVTQKK